MQKQKKKQWDYIYMVMEGVEELRVLKNEIAFWKVRPIFFKKLWFIFLKKWKKRIVGWQSFMTKLRYKSQAMKKEKKNRIRKKAVFCVEQSQWKTISFCLLENE